MCPCVCLCVCLCVRLALSRSLSLSLALAPPSLLLSLSVTPPGPTPPLYTNAYLMQRTVPAGGTIIWVTGKKDDAEVILPEETFFEWNA